MPSLQWSSKSDQYSPEGALQTESIIYSDPEAMPIEQAANRLILGDNLRVMNALLPEFEGKIDLIYADPPFFTNKGYSARVGRGEDSRKPEEWKLAEGYKDEWDDLNSYLDMLHPRLQMIHRLLSPTGSFFLHLDWHANSYARILLDEIFGYDNYRNEIIWTYHGPSPIRSAFNRKHDMILFYSKSDQYKFNVDDVRIPYASNTIETFKSSKKAGFGKMPDLERGKVPEDWWYFPVVARLHSERTGYPTQKPEALIERIILAATDRGDLVADFFGGAGTTAVVASRLERQFISSDFQPRALQTAQSRLVLSNQQISDVPSGKKIGSRHIHIQREESQLVTPLISLKDLGLPEPTLENGIVKIPEDLLSRMLYWEIDPDWQGPIYNSKYQAVRPWRKGDIPSSILLGDSFKGKICVRIRMISGDLAQVIL
jgi:DNA modification methylase